MSEKCTCGHQRRKHRFYIDYVDSNGYRECTETNCECKKYDLDCSILIKARKLFPNDEIKRIDFVLEYWNK